MKKIIIGIPAYNEEKTIGGLLEDIFNQRLESEFDVLVVSDNSSDMTDNVVLSFMEKHNNINMIKKEKRTGKSSSLNLIFEISKDYDILILLDADIRLRDNTLRFLLEKFDLEVDLVAGNPIPIIEDNSTIASRAAFFGWAIGTGIKDTQTHSLYHPYGCVLGLSRRLFNDLKISAGIGNDTFIYLCCMQKKFIFEYEPRAVVYIKVSNTIDNYLKQSIRRTKALEEHKKVFGNEIVEKHLRIKNKYIIFMKTLLRYPFHGLCWAVLYSYGQIFLYKRKISATWEIADSTKQVK